MPHVEVTEPMVTAAMRAFERMSSVLRYREAQKWHACDVMGMHDAIKAALEAQQPPRQLVTKHRPDPDLDRTLSAVNDAINQEER